MGFTDINKYFDFLDISELGPPVFNLINSNIGVGILAMPFCFHECGIMLTLCILALMAVITFFACDSILNSCIFFRCNSFESAAYKSHGIPGKRLIELSIIGLLFGMLVGFNVSISDMGSEVLATFTNANVTSLRRVVLIAVVGSVTPFCLLRRVEVMSIASFCAVLIYCIFIINLIIGYAIPRLGSENLLEHMRLWRCAGLVHAVPIIASSICCQVQVNVIYNSLSDGTPGKMRRSLAYAIGFIVSAYALAGFFGYCAFLGVGHGEKPEEGHMVGNMLSMYPKDYRADLVRLCFLYTVTVSFPLILFPLRCALHSLIFEEHPNEEELVSPSLPMPESRFRWLTFSVIAASVVISQVTDRVEVILSASGSFAGALTCYILPALVYLHLLGGQRSTWKGLAAVALLAFGVLVLFSPVFTFIGVDVPLELAVNDNV